VLAWSIVVESDREFLFVTEFSDLKYISQFETDPDSLKVKVLRPEVFVSADSKPVIVEN